MLYSEQMALIADHQVDLPVQTVPIAEALGLKVYRIKGWPSEIAGLIKKAPDGGGSGFSIYVNADHPAVRRRFTIAHELGHFVLHRSLIGDGIVEDALLRAEGLTNSVEAQANRFAADLLMPWHLIEAAEGRGLKSIPDLANAFEVSRDAMSIRLLGISWERAREAEQASNQERFDFV